MPRHVAGSPTGLRREPECRSPTPRSPRPNHRTSKPSLSSSRQRGNSAAGPARSYAVGAAEDKREAARQVRMTASDRNLFQPHRIMKLSLRLLALVSILLLPLQLAAQGPARPAPTEKRVYKETGDTKLELWIYKPADWKATDHRGAIVFFHGGGWRNGSPNAFSRQSAKLAERGMVAISVQYRLTSQTG